MVPLYPSPGITALLSTFGIVKSIVPQKTPFVKGNVEPFTYQVLEKGPLIGKGG